MPLDNQTIREVVVKNKLAEGKALQSALDQLSTPQDSLLDILLHDELVNRHDLGKAIAQHFKMPFADLSKVQPSQDDLLMIPETKAHEFRFVVAKRQGNIVIIATDNPIQDNLNSELNKLFPEKNIKIVFSLPDEIDHLLNKYHKLLNVQFKKIIEQGENVANALINEVLNQALSMKASDIHLEPQGNRVLIRYRIDGIMYAIGRIPQAYYDNMLNRIKVYSQLRIDEHYAPQDGSMHFDTDSHSADLRISIIPTLTGEQIVIRILSAYIQSFTFEDLGLSVVHQKMLETAIKKPFGMILVSGPTGSGKTTSLYAIIKLINNPRIKITTIEDPVEYRIKGVSQIQVRNDSNLTFATGLRSIVRQDPDVILVGEIRDEETAEIAVNAALTGHQLFSTFHANDSATSIPRLLEMGIEPFLLSSTLELVIAQRLVRKLCATCRVSKSYTAAEMKKKFPHAAPYIDRKKMSLWSAKGCSECSNTGYTGRTGVFELIPITPELREIILTRPSSQEIWKYARAQGAVSMFEDGIEKVDAGMTTLDELFRVAEPNAPDATQPNKESV